MCHEATVNGYFPHPHHRSSPFDRDSFHEFCDFLLQNLLKILDDELSYHMGVYSLIALTLLCTTVKHVAHIFY